MTELAARYIDEEKGVTTADQAISGAMDIIAGGNFRQCRIPEGYQGINIQTRYYKNLAKRRGSPYRMYYDFEEPISKIAPHRVLAINRGEKEEFLSVKLQAPEERIIEWLKSRIITNPGSIFGEIVEKALEDSYSRLIAPSIENEIRATLTENASEQAIKVFAENLRNLLLQPPVKGKVVLGWDPAYRTAVNWQW